ncbi:MAG: DUF58 domain-containing protein [Gemmatimonadetes bacterium]|nr:DUF58 domain-containing protein [Gemmatimonadota bacterium]
MPAAPGYGALLDALRGVSWPARVASRGATAGTHKSRLRGSSAEFTEYRAYRQGDDPRRLDWKLLARTDRAYLRITNERATLPTLLVVDASASMRFPAGTADKWAQARAVAVGLAGVAHAAGDPVALVVPGSPPRRLPFRARRGVVSDVARVLDGVPPAGDAGLAPVLREQGRAARLAIVTDLLGDGAALLRVAREQRSRGVEVVLVHVVAREELDPPAGARLAEDPEAPELRRALVGATREPYRAAFAAWRAGVARAWRAAGARYVEVVTDEPSERAVRRVVGTSHEGIDA